MDIEELRSAVQSALKRMSAERIAAEAGSITAKSVLNFSSGDVKTPRHDQRQALEAFVQSQAANRGPSNTRGRVIKRNHPGLIEGVIRDGQEEQVRWVREFAARVLEASARQLRAMPTDISVEELEDDDRAIDRLEDSNRPPKTAGKKPKKRATA